MAMPAETESMTQVSNVPYLPTEMLSEIVNWAVRLPGKPCLRRLSLASSTLRALAQPLLLREINIGPFALEGSVSIEDQLEELSSRTSLASKYARTVVIDFYGEFWPEDARCEETVLMEHLKQAIVSFKNVEKVIWYPRDKEWQLIHQTIGRALLELAPEQIAIEWLDNISLIEPTVHDNSETLRQVIKDLIQRSPQITRLDLNLPDLDPFNLEFFADMLDTSLSRIEHLGLANAYITSDQFESVLYRLPNLKSLSFHDKGPEDASRYELPDTRAALWEIFKDRKIKLLKISTNTSNDVYGLLCYLASYRVLEHLELDVLKPTPNSTPLHPLILLIVLLQNHSRSLLNLSIRAVNGQTAWMWQNFTCIMKGCLFRFCNLQCLELTAKGASEENIISLLASCDRCLPNLEHLILDGPWSKGNQNHGQFAPLEATSSFLDEGLPALPDSEPPTYDLDIIPRFNHHSYIPSEIDPESRQTIRAIVRYNGKRVFETPAFSIVLGRLLFFVFAHPRPKTGVMSLSMMVAKCHTSKRPQKSPCHWMAYYFVRFLDGSAVASREE